MFDGPGTGPRRATDTVGGWHRRYGRHDWSITIAVSEHQWDCDNNSNVAIPNFVVGVTSISLGESYRRCCCCCWWNHHHNATGVMVLPKWW